MGLDGKNILITGGAGAIGGVLASRLAEISSNVIVLDDLSSGYKSNVPGDVEFAEGSILDDNLLLSIFKRGIDVIFHLAACFANQNSIDHPELDLAVNGMGTLKLLEYAVKYKADKFIYSSSSCVDKSIHTPYALSKRLGEEYTFLYGKQYGLNVTVLRYYNSYGPGDRPGVYRSVIPNFIHSVLKGEDMIITGHGSETRDFTYVDDVVEGTILACSESTDGELFNIGSGKRTKIIDLAIAIQDAAAGNSNIVFKPRRSWDTVGDRVAEISLAEKRLGYHPKVDLKQGLKKTIDWFKKELR